MRISCTLLLAGMLFSSATPSAARAGDVKDVGRFALAPVARIATAPSIDGVVGKREWYGAALLPRLVGAADGAVAARRSRVYLAYDDANLYVAFQFDRPLNSLIPAESDVCEVLIDAAHEHKVPVSFTGNSAGPLVGEGWQYKARVTDFGWEGEMAIPFAELKRQTPTAGEVWGFDLVNRQETPVLDVSAVSHTAKRASARELNHIVFAPAGAPVVRFRETGTFFTETGGGASVELVNSGDAPVDASVTMELLRRKPGLEGGPATYLKGIAQATFNEGADLVLPAEDLAVMQKEHLDRYVPATGDSAKLEKSAPLPAHQRTEYRVTQTEPGDYLCRYQVKSGSTILAAGIAPFTLSAPLQVTVRPFFLSPKVLEVKAKLTRVPEWKEGAKLKFAIVRKSEGTQPLSVVEKKFDGSQAFAVEVPTDKLGPGGYELTTELTDADGKQAALLSEGFTKLADPKWITEPVANDPIVPPPWTPIVADAKQISTLTGDYQLGASIWPQQMNVRTVFDAKRAPMLRAPMSLKGRVNGKEITWAESPKKTTGKHDYLVAITGGQTFEGLSINSNVEFEYDGMAKVVMDLAPAADGAKPAIDALWLEVPLTPEMSKLFQYAPTPTGVKGPRPAGAFKGDETLKWEFIFSMWLGNEERGFRWFAENWRGWKLGKNAYKQCIEVVNSAEGATLRVHYVKHDDGEQPFVLEKPRQIVFGYQFTPPRTLDPRMVYKTIYNEKFDFEQPVGANVSETWYYKYQGWPEIYTPEELAEKNRIAKYTHDHGMLLVPYSGWYIARDSDVYKQFGAEMTNEPNANAGCGCDQCCWNTAVTDAYTSLLRDRILDSDIDGFRMDAGFSAENCESLIHRAHGSVCGWYDDDGKLQPSRGIFAARKAAQRAYRLFHVSPKTTGMCLHHIHQGNRYDAILSHQDAVVSAEGPELHMKQLSDFPLDFYRAFVMGDAHGYRVVYMSKGEKIGIDSRVGLCVLHNLIPRGRPIIGMREVSNSRNAMGFHGVWQAYRWIGVDDLKGTELWGYWKNAEYLNTGDPMVSGTFYVRRGEKLLLGLLNFDRKPVERTITVNFDKLGFAGKTMYARDANTFDEIPVENNNAVKLAFTAEGYRLIEFATQPLNPFHPERISENLIPEISPKTWDDKAIAAQWYHRSPADGVKPAGDDTIVVTGKGTTEEEATAWRKILTTAKPGQHFMLDCEARLDVPDGVFVDPGPEIQFARIELGEVYFNHARTFGAQTAPGHWEKVRLWFTMNEEAPKVYLGMRGNGMLTIRNLQVHQINHTAPRPGFAQ